MSEEPVETATPAEDNRVDDLVLQHLVGLVNRYPGTNFGVTLVVAGAVITGDIIGVKEYFESYADLWKRLLKDGPEIAEQMASDWREVGASHTEAAQKDPDALFNFIHLKNACIVAGGVSGVIPTSGGLLWRGRIETVSGFSIGKLAASSAG